MKKNEAFNGLILEYMRIKLICGYEPMFTIEEFLGLLQKQFQLEIELDDVNNIIQDFFHFMKNPWSEVYYLPCRTEFHPHMIQDENGIHATNRFADSDYDIMLRIPSFLGLDRNVISERIMDYLKDFPKRRFVTLNALDDSVKELSKMISTTLLGELLPEEVTSFVSCTDSSSSHLSFYQDLSNRIACFINENQSFLVQNICPGYRENYFGYSNYLLLIRGYEDLMRRFDGIFLYIKLDGDVLHVRIGDHSFDYTLENLKVVKVKTQT